MYIAYPMQLDLVFERVPRGVWMIWWRAQPESFLLEIRWFG
jgi:hypothetical protein